MFKEFLKRYGIEIAVGCVLTWVAMNRMEEVRGRCALGGEMLILPLVFAFCEIFRRLKEDGFFDLLLYGDDDDEWEGRE